MLRESEAYGPSSFQSTLSMRRATSCSSDAFSGMIFQSTLSMRRATALQNAYAKATEFQSTLSMRRATLSLGIRRETYCISIHALHEESDLWRECRQPSSWNFNPRSP